MDQLTISTGVYFKENTKVLDNFIKINNFQLIFIYTNYNQKTVRNIPVLACPVGLVILIPLLRLVLINGPILPIQYGTPTASHYISTIVQQKDVHFNVKKKIASQNMNQLVQINQLYEQSSKSTGNFSLSFFA